MCLSFDRKSQSLNVQQFYTLYLSSYSSVRDYVNPYTVHLVKSLFFFIFFVQFNVLFKIISLISRRANQKVGRKREYPGKNHLTHLQVELDLSHLWPVWGSNPHQSQRWDDRMVKGDNEISHLNHSATGGRRHKVFKIVKKTKCIKTNNNVSATVTWITLNRLKRVVAFWPNSLLTLLGKQLSLQFLPCVPWRLPYLLPTVMCACVKEIFCETIFDWTKKYRTSNEN